MEKILFRADSSSMMGTGHIMRDLVLAKQLKNATIFFATRTLNGNIDFKIREENYTHLPLKTNHPSEVIEYIRFYGIHTLVIDHYALDSHYEKRIKEETSVRLIVFDDLYKTHFCDILLNPNIYATKETYHSLVPKECTVKCGPQIAFNLLREEFFEEKKKRVKFSSPSHPPTLLVTMGGTDQKNNLLKILSTLEKREPLSIIVVTTTANNNLKRLKEYTFERKSIELHINTNQIATLMSRSDLAITTPSITLNELIYMELPFIAIKTAENQTRMYDFLVKNKLRVLEKFDEKRFLESLSEYFKSTKALYFKNLDVYKNTLKKTTILPPLPF